MYHILNLHDVGSVREEAHCQPQGITSHSITSRPVVLNYVQFKWDKVDFQAKFLIRIDFSPSFSWMLTMQGTWQWSARSMETNRFWFLDHSSHSNIRIPFHTSYRPGFSNVVQPSIKPSSNPVFPVVVQCCVGLGGYPVVGAASTYLPVLLPAPSLPLYWYWRWSFSIGMIYIHQSMIDWLQIHVQ